MAVCVEKKHILLVEDNPDDVELTKRAMKKAGILNPIVVAEDGAEALKILLDDEGADLPTLVLLDLKLPKVSGLDVLRKIRANDRTALLPVVILTTSQEERDLVDGYRLSANSYIRKPVSFQEFVEAVAHLGFYWLMLNEPPPAMGR